LNLVDSQWLDGGKFLILFFASRSAALRREAVPHNAIWGSFSGGLFEGPPGDAL
jgi:hypothetical protein